MYNKSDLEKCTLCDLHLHRTHPLCGEGNLQADLLFIAQAPGEYEDKKDCMFIGPSGVEFRNLLHDAGICIDDIYMTNLIKCNLPQNRSPKQREIQACSKFLLQEIDFIQPQILVPLGFYATSFLFRYYNKKDLSRKEFHNVIGNIYPLTNRQCFPLSHPAALLYNTEYRESAEIYYKKLTFLLNK